MLYRLYIPPPPLSAFVSCFWYSEGFEGTHQRERLLPNGESSVVFDLRERPICIFGGDNESKVEFHAPAIFCGARTDCFVIETSAQERVLGVQFRPGGAAPFLSLPASEVAGGTHALADAWGGAGTPASNAMLLREQILNAKSIPAIFAILEQALLARLNRLYALHPAIAFAARALAQPSATIRVSTVADQIGFSTRRFGDLFREQTGLTPKAFHRVRRFQHVLQTLRERRDDNWAALALDCGYYDQAHFIHDFKDFSGLTPAEYITIATPHLNHVPLK